MLGQVLQPDYFTTIISVDSKLAHLENSAT